MIANVSEESNMNIIGNFLQRIDKFGNLFKAWDKTRIFDIKNNLCHKQSISICVHR